MHSIFRLHFPSNAEQDSFIAVIRCPGPGELRGTILQFLDGLELTKTQTKKNYLK